MTLINISDIAWKKLLEKLSASGNNNLYVSLNNKGCGGSSYTFTPTNLEPQNDEKFIENDGIKVIIDSKAEIFVAGSTLDWVEQDQFNKGFDIVSNDKEIGRCGCGQSILFNQ